jgi:tripartite-type tricarboxylate transporter receptor subunit TctC
MKRHLALAFALSLAGTALAQSYPSKPIRIFSPFSIGNPADTSLRIATQKMGESMGQPIIIEVQTAASGVGAAQLLIRSAPDGYTLLYALESMLMTPPFLIKAKPFDPLKDFTPVTSMFFAPLAIAVSPSFPANSVRELIALARANPGKYAYGTNGIGGTYHLEMELLKQQFGIDLVQVPYKTSTEAVQAAVAGEIPIVYSPVGQLSQHVRAGKLRFLVVLHPKRTPELPNVPAMGEEVNPYQQVPTAVNLYGPAGLPMTIARRVQGEFVKAIAIPDVQSKLREITFYGLGAPPEEVAAAAVKAYEVYARAVKAAKLEPQ